MSKKNIALLIVLTALVSLGKAKIDPDRDSNRNSNKDKHKDDTITNTNTNTNPKEKDTNSLFSLLSEKFDEFFELISPKNNLTNPSPSLSTGRNTAENTTHTTNNTLHEELSELFQLKVPHLNHSHYIDIFVKEFFDLPTKMPEIHEMPEIKKTNATLSKLIKEIQSNITDITKSISESHSLPIAPSLPREDYFNFQKKIKKFMSKIQDYLLSNETDYGEYMNKSMNMNMNTTNLKPYAIWYHEEYIYYPEHDLLKTCNGSQINRCHKKCEEKGKILCGCYVVDSNKGIDCVCADTNELCAVRHEHNIMNVNSEPEKKENVNSKEKEKKDSL